MRILDRLPRESGRDYALRTIKDNIIHLDLAPGSLISENELAVQLGLSRTPVLEALIELSRSKVVEIAPQKRTVVAPIDSSLVEEARFTRYVLECAVVELVCTMATPEDILHLGENVKLQEFYIENGPLNALMDLDDAFHKMLFDIAKKSQLYSLIQYIAIHFDRVRSLALSNIQDLKIVNDHRQILDAICCRDGAKAKEIMSKHLSRSKVDAASLREKFPHYFRKDASET